MRNVQRLLAVLIALPACSDDSGGAPDAVPIDAVPIDARDPNDDDNDSFAEEDPITIGDANGVSGVIQAPGDRDYYTFTATAGQWLHITTTANPTDDPDLLDTVVRVFGPDSTTAVLAENDDDIPRTGTDSEIILRAPANGVYHLLIQDYSDWTGGVPEFGPDYTYTLRVLDATTALPSTVEPMADPATPTAVTAFPRVLLSKFDTATDVDEYLFTLAAPGFLELSAMPDGRTGHGSTADVGNVSVTDAAGTTTIARLNLAAGPSGPFQVIPSLVAGSYRVAVERQAGGSAANPFWVAKVRSAPESREAEVTAGSNDTPATAEVLTMVASGNRSQGAVVADLSAATDVDVFRFDFPTGNNVGVHCRSASTGSGVQGLRLEIVGADGTTVVGMGTETTPLLSVFATGPASAYYVRLSKGGQSATVAGAWARCNVVTGPPA